MFRRAIPPSEVTSHCSRPKFGFVGKRWQSLRFADTRVGQAFGRAADSSDGGVTSVGDVEESPAVAAVHDVHFGEPPPLDRTDTGSVLTGVESDARPGWRKSHDIHGARCMTATQKHLLDWKFWDSGEILEVLELARRVKRQRWSFRPPAGTHPGDALPEDLHPHPGIVRSGHDGARGARDQPRLARIELHVERHSVGDAIPVAQLGVHHGQAEEPRRSCRHGIRRHGAGDQRLLQPLSSCQALADMLTIAEDRAETRAARALHTSGRTTTWRIRWCRSPPHSGCAYPRLPDSRRSGHRRREPGPPARPRSVDRNP